MMSFRVDRDDLSFSTRNLLADLLFNFASSLVPICSIILEHSADAHDDNWHDSLSYTTATRTITNAYKLDPNNFF